MRPSRLQLRRAHGAVPKLLQEGRPVVGDQKLVAICLATRPKCASIKERDFWLGADLRGIEKENVVALPVLLLHAHAHISHAYAHTLHSHGKHVQSAKVRSGSPFISLPRLRIIAGGAEPRSWLPGCRPASSPVAT